MLILQWKRWWISLLMLGSRKNKLPTICLHLERGVKTTSYLLVRGKKRNVLTIWGKQQPISKIWADRISDSHNLYDGFRPIWYGCLGRRKIHKETAEVKLFMILWMIGLKWWSGWSWGERIRTSNLINNWWGKELSSRVKWFDYHCLSFQIH